MSCRYSMCPAPGLRAAAAILVGLCAATAGGQERPPASTEATPLALPQEPEQAYIQALRQRKLYRLLEAYCRRQLARPGLSPAAQARYTLELANVLADRAGQETEPAKRDGLWQRASAVLSGFVADHPAHPQLPVIRLQLGVFELARGELLRRQAGVVGGEQAVRLVGQARRHLQAAAGAFQAVDRRVAELQKELKPDQPSTPQRLGHRQLRPLSANARFRLAQSWLAMARLESPKSAQRSDLARRAERLFQEFTARYSTSPLVLESWLGRAECLRLLGNRTEALKSLRQIERPTTPAEYRDRALVLRVRLTLERHQASLARDLIAESRELLQQPSAELDLLYLQATLQSARQLAQTGDLLQARQMLGDAGRAIDRIQQLHGAYWLARAELLLAELACDQLPIDRPGLLGRLANGQYRRGDRQQAVQTLDRAARLADERQRTDLAFDQRYQAASIMLEAGRLREAAERFQSLADRYTTHSRASQAHFLAACCLGKLWQAEPTAERLVPYAEALRQHQSRFPAAATASEARWLLGTLYLRQRRWQQAIDMLRRVAAGHPRGPAARRAAGQAYESWLLELWAKSQPADRVVEQAVEFFRSALGGWPPPPLTADQVPLALQFARILTAPAVGRYGQAEAVLERVLFGTAAGERQRAEARRLGVVALVQQDKFDAAGRMLQAEVSSKPQELLALVKALEAAAADSSGPRRQRIGQLELLATERLVRQADQLDDHQKLQAQIHLALAQVNAGHPVQADELFRSLRDRLPDEPRILEAQAESAMQLAQYQKARELWRQLLAQLPEGSAAWFEAKYKLALACYHGGHRRQCLKIITVTELLHPELGGPELHARFEALKDKCKSSE